MRRRSRFALLASLVLVTRVALADPSPADRAQARTLAQEGQAAYEAKKYGVAIDRFSRADSLVHAPTLLLGLARAQVGLGKLVDAQENYNRIIREGVDPSAPHAWAKALADASKEVEAIAPRIGWVTITVLGPTTPEVVIDSTPVPVASLGTKRPVNPGTHKFKAGAEGFLPGEKSVTIGEGQTVAVNLELEQAPVEATAPVAKAPAVPGDTAPTDTTDTTGTRRTLAFVGFGLGGAGLIVGGITGVLAVEKHSKLVKACPNGSCPADGSEDSALKSYHTMGTLSTVGFVVAGVGAAAGAILLLTLPKAPDPAAAQIHPFVGVGSAGVWGTF